ncbi:MAG: hypothetical protein ACLFRR_08690 [Spirochaetaceae bacterium]
MRGRTFLLIALVLTAIDVLIPYLLIADVARFTGTYLFWCALTLAAIIGAAVYTRRWTKWSKP